MTALDADRWVLYSLLCAGIGNRCLGHAHQIRLAFALSFAFHGTSLNTFLNTWQARFWPYLNTFWTSCSLPFQYKSIACILSPSPYKAGVTGSSPVLSTNDFEGLWVAATAPHCLYTSSCTHSGSGGRASTARCFCAVKTC